MKKVFIALLLLSCTRSLWAQDAQASPAAGTPPQYYINDPGDVIVVTDGKDFRIKWTGTALISTEVYKTKQEALDWIFKEHKKDHPNDERDYKPAP